MALEPTTSIAKWQRATKRVEANLRTGRYINAETALIFVGPPRLTDIGGLDANVQQASTTAGQAPSVFGTTGAADALYPVGLVEQFSLQQFQNVQKMFEIGSRRSYQAGGRVQVSGSIGRVMFNGPSLLRVLYAYYPSVIQQANGKFLGRDATPDSLTSKALPGANAKRVFPSIYFAAGAFATAEGKSDPGQPRNSFFINLMSELFSHPFGIGTIFRDNQNRNYGAYYCEDCMVNSHSLAISSASTLITEAVNFQCDAAVPMEFATDNDAFRIAPLAGNG